MSSVGPTGPAGTDKINIERRTVHLNFAPPPDPAAAPSARDARTPAAAARDRWLRTAERLVGGWAPTLRAALLMLVTFVGVVVLVGVTLGFGGALTGALVSGVTLYAVGRSSSRQRPDQPGGATRAA